MTKKFHGTIALCVIALACAIPGFAQDSFPQQDSLQQQQSPQPDTLQQDTLQQDTLQQDSLNQAALQEEAPPQESPEQETPQLDTLQQDSLKQDSIKQAPPQQAPAYHSQLMALKQTPEQAPQQPVAPPAPPRQRSVGFFMGINADFYYSELDCDKDGSDEVEQSYEGKGANFTLGIGILIRDFVGIRGILGIGAQNGDSYYKATRNNGNWYYREIYDNETTTDVTDFTFGVSATIFPSNRKRNALYNFYIEGSTGLTMHSFADKYAEYLNRSFSATSILKIELGKLFPITDTFNVGAGLAYSFNINDYENRTSIWAGVRLVHKRNKTE
ncbi:MAG: hypothetical protein J6U20_09780 [Fibrobacter sp.]|nr:hypothetical protein [Fibrobacter sp.]